jgi:hypothetical protein
MAKRILGQLKETVEESKGKGGLNLHNTVITTPEKIEKLSNNAKKQEQKEKRDASGMTYLTKTEMETFLSLIGRKSFSDATRELILSFLKKNKSV